MASLSLRAEDRKLALVRRGDDVLWHPEPLLAADLRAWTACVDDFIETHRIRIHTGSLADNMKSRAMAWTARDFAVGDGAEKWAPALRCPLYTHELRHCVEIPHHRKDGTMQLKYVFRVRFRWAMEMQAEIAVFRWWRKMRVGRAVALARAEDNARSLARPFPGYNMGRIKGLRHETVGLLMDVFDGKVAA